MTIVVKPQNVVPMKLNDFTVLHILPWLHIYSASKELVIGQASKMAQKQK